MGLDTDHRIGGGIELNSVGNRFISGSVTRGKYATIWDWNGSDWEKVHSVSISGNAVALNGSGNISVLSEREFVDNSLHKVKICTHQLSTPTINPIAQQDPTPTPTQTPIAQQDPTPTPTPTPTEQELVTCSNLSCKRCIHGSGTEIVIDDNDDLWVYGHTRIRHYIEPASEPTKIDSNVREVTGTMSSVFYNKNTNELYGFGRNSYGQLGNDDAVYTPRLIQANVQQVSTDDHGVGFVTSGESFYYMGTDNDAFR